YKHQIALARDSSKQTERDNLCRKHGWVTKSRKPKRPLHWWDEKMESRAQAAGIQFEEDYWDKYSMLSQYLHPGGAGIDRISSKGLGNLFYLAHANAQEWF